MTGVAPGGGGAPGRTWLLERAEPVAWSDVLLLDLDGVVYVGPDAVPFAVTALDAARAAGVRVAYVTNNAARPPAEVAEHLTALGLHATASDVVTSAQAGARLVAERVPAGSRVLAVGGPGVAAALRERGLEPVTREEDRPAAVLQGYGPDVSWRDLAEASYAVARGVPWIATNTDRTIPTPGGRAPGNGTLVGVVAEAGGRGPDAVAGKPEAALVAESVERTEARRPLMVGDRLDTDIEGAVRSGMESLLVLTGVTHLADLLAAAPGQRPTLVSYDLRGLLHDHPAPVLEGSGWRCGDTAAEVRDGELRVRGVTEASALDAVRAAAAAAWTAADAGHDVDVREAAEVLAAAVGGAAESATGADASAS